jgi:hypothetical protein
VAPRSRGARGVGQERLPAARVPGPTGGSSLSGAAGRSALADAGLGEETDELVLHHVGQRTGHEKLVGVRLGQLAREGGQARVLALRERRLDAAAGVVEDPYAGREAPRSRSAPAQVGLMTSEGRARGTGSDSAAARSAW